MTTKEKYRLLCQAEESIPIFSRDWWLDMVCGEKYWDVSGIEHNGQLIATMPLYTPLPGIVSMPPYTQTMGIWFLSPPEDKKYTTWLGQKQAMCRELIHSLKSYASFYQLFPYTFTDWLPFYWAGYSQTTRYTYVLRDIRMEEKLWENMATNIRRNITKAREKQGITVRKGIPTAAFMHVFKATFQRQNQSITQDINVLGRLIEVCRQRGQGDLWGGYDREGRLHAAVFVVWQKSSAYYIAGGGDPALRASGAHSLVMWETIRQVSSYTDTFDFEGSMLPGVERFFREFGAVQMPFFTIIKGKLSLLDKVRLKLNRYKK